MAASTKTRLVTPLLVYGPRSTIEGRATLITSRRPELVRRFILQHSNTGDFVAAVAGVIANLGKSAEISKIVTGVRG